MAIDYKSAGVDVERGYEAVRLMKKYVKETYTDGVLGDLGSFGGFYALDDKPDGDVLVAAPTAWEQSSNTPLCWTGTIRWA